MATKPDNCGSLSPSAADPTPDGKVICVDLDGTLVRTDTLCELLLVLLRHHPLHVFLLPLWLLRGKAHLKERLHERYPLAVETLPYREDFVEFLQAERRQGRRLMLVTGADQGTAARVAEHFRFFESVLGSNGSRNLVGRAKAAAIQSALGATPFLYAGNSRHDFHVWKHARAAIVVDATPSLIAAVQARSPIVYKAFPRRPGTWKSVLEALRVHQWAKNSLIFLPLLLSHRIFVVPLLLKAIQGFIAFSCAASSLYVVNDLLDVESDRRHHRKRNRPFASGALSIWTGFLLAGALAVLSAAFSYTLPWMGAATLLLYCATALAYSLYLKKQLFLDVVVLAGFFTLRMIFGAEITGIVISIWTAAGSMFLFLSLALVKRLTELRVAFSVDKTSSLPGRDYAPADSSMIACLSAASGFSSVLVIALYLQSPEVHLLYSHPPVLWLLCPLVIYWLGRILILANRGALHDDPMVFAFTDIPSLIVGALCLAVLVCAL